MNHGLLLVLLVAVFTSGASLIYSKHLTRQRHGELQTLRLSYDNLLAEREALRTELSARTTPARLEPAARAQGLEPPAPANVEPLRP